MARWLNKPVVVSYFVAPQILLFGKIRYLNSAGICTTKSSPTALMLISKLVRRTAPWHK
ncbi:hypothetical protein Plhal703r1_c02g0009451 [Plasmopara halstedii]